MERFGIRDERSGIFQTRGDRPTPSAAGYEKLCSMRREELIPGAKDWAKQFIVARGPLACEGLAARILAR
jgi:hypothetical protein